MNPVRGLARGRAALSVLLAGFALQGFGVSGACAADLSPPEAAEYRPVARSTLVTDREPAFAVARRRPAFDGADATTVLAIRPNAGAPQPVARLVQRGQGPGTRVSVQRLPPGAPERASGGVRTDEASLETAILEQLYALILRMEPEARYCLGEDRLPCDAAHDGLSHGDVLQRLAEARERSAALASAATPWRVVAMQRAATGTWDADVVGVVARGPHGPLQGVPIYFHRAPHSLCVGRTGADGVAVCRLVDQHGDGHQHDHAAPVVATFAGDVAADRVLLPTTHVMVTPPALAKPFVFPGAFTRLGPP